MCRRSNPSCTDRVRGSSRHLSEPQSATHSTLQPDGNVAELQRRLSMQHLPHRGLPVRLPLVADGGPYTNPLHSADPTRTGQLSSLPTMIWAWLADKWVRVVKTAMRIVAGCITAKFSDREVKCFLRLRSAEEILSVRRHQGKARLIELDGKEWWEGGDDRIPQWGILRDPT